MRAKKSYGQHFLNSDQIAMRIADSLQWTDRYKTVLEIGPGRGMLTQFLLAKEYELFVVEADRDMVSHLQKHFPDLKEHIISADFLKVPLDKVFSHEFGLIGNFPYNISSQILFQMVRYKALIPEMVGMFQKEVADRVVAKPGSKVYGVISVLVQAFYEGEYLFSVEKESFNPPPKVRSGVIRLYRKANQNLGCDEKLFRQVVKQAFSQRRKMLRNTMKTFLKGDDFLQDELFNLRPERLSVADFVQLTNMIAERLPKES
ncbi:MAG: 16S rRNA (adenine(1518)-N(6)/adenine(1519)-N(6))-dimethyltransferase RsmA [Saprospiraceae bacterium]